MTRNISCNQMRQFTFIRMLDSDSNHHVFHPTTHYHLCAHSHGKQGLDSSEWKPQFSKKSHYYHNLSLNHEGHWSTTVDFTTNVLHFSLFSTALWDLANSRPVHSLMLSSHLFLCLPCLLSPFTVPCKMVLARPDEMGDMTIPLQFVFLYDG